MNEYELRRSRRKTLGLEVTRDGRVIVRAPLRASQKTIDAFVQAQQDWLQRALARQKARADRHPEPDAARAAALFMLAQKQLPDKVRFYAERMGLYPTGVRITSARTRFGSCSAKNSICFSWRLMDYPEAAVDYVVVHELAHIAHKNHGPAFWACVASVFPDYKARRALLR